MTKGKSIVEDTVLDLYCTTFPKSLNIADLGFSTGPYALLMITEIKDAINERCRELSCCLPELNVFLNDLPGNDFNTIFKSLPFFFIRLSRKRRATVPAHVSLQECLVPFMRGFSLAILYTLFMLLTVSIGSLRRACSFQSNKYAFSRIEGVNGVK